MRKLLSLVVLFWTGAAFASIQGTFPSTGPIRSGSPTTSSTGQWVLEETLFHPVAFSSAKAGVTVSAVPRESKTLRLAYKVEGAGSWTTLTRCWKNRDDALDTKDTDGTCNVTGMQRVDFVLCDPNDSYNSCLAENTHYVYRLEELSGATWIPKGESDFWTIDTDPDATQRVAFISDEHISQRFSQAGCAITGAAQDETAETSNWFKTVANLKSLQGSRQYRAYLGSGDTFQTHGLNYTDTPCTKIEGLSSGGCGWEEACSGSRINSVTTQSETDMRVLFTLQILQPILRQLPYVFTCGNHDPCGFTYAEDHGTVISQSANEHWYIDASNNINVYTLNALHRWMPNAAFTYGGVEGNASIDGDGRWYSFVIGPAEVVVLCAECGAGEDPTSTFADGDLDHDGTPWEGDDLATPGQGDFPGNVNGWDDWYPGRVQCTYMTGNVSCSGTSGRLRDTTWDANTDGDDNEATTTGEVFPVFYKLTLRHHVFGSTTQTTSGKWYGRGGQGAVDRRCDADGTTMCTVDTDCFGLTPATCPAYTGLEDMAGYEADVQREMAAFATAVGGKSYGAHLLGHDHLSNGGVKFTSGPTNTHVAYFHGVQPAGSQSGPGWADNEIMKVASDWGGDDNTPDGVPDYCDNASVEAINLFGTNFYACHDLGDGSVTYDQGGIGSLTRGFLEVEFEGRNALNVRQIATVSSLDTAAGFSLLNKAELWQLTLSEDAGAPSGDTTPPVISNLSHSNITTTAAQIDWDTDDLATSRVLYAPAPALPTSGTAISDTPANINGVTFHVAQLLGLTPGTDYNYQAESTNDAGLTTFSSVGTFSTPNPPAPIISNFRFINSSTSTITLAWDTDVASSSQASCGLTTGGPYTTSSPNDTTPVFAHSATVSGLAEGTLYYCVGLSTNTPGGTTTSSEVSATTDTVGVGALTMGDLLTPEAVAMIDADGDGVAEKLRWPAWDDTTYQASKAWPEFDVTCNTAPCASGLDPWTDDAGMAGGGCSSVTTGNAGNVRCMVNNASAQVRLVFPNGTYTLADGIVIQIGRDDIVLAAQNPGGATINSFNDGRSNPGGACSVTPGDQNYVSASMITICNPNAYSGSTVKTWTGGYTNGETNLTIPSHGFSPGDMIEVKMNSGTACDRYQRLTNSGQQSTFSTNHYAKVSSVPDSDHIVIDDPLRGTYNGPGCTGHTARLVDPVQNVGIEGLILSHDATIPNCSASTGCAKFPKITTGFAKNVWLIGNKFLRNYEAWVRLDIGSQDIEIQGNWFDLLDPTIVANTEGIWVKRANRVHMENNYITRTNVASKSEHGAEATTFNYNLVPCDAGGPKRSIERSILGAHGFWVRQTLIEGNDFCGNPDIADPYWGENEGPMAYYGNRVVGSGSGECDRTSYLAVNTDAGCTTVGTNCCRIALNDPDHCYAVDTLFTALNGSYLYLGSPRLAQCPALTSRDGFNGVIAAHYMERNTYRHPAGFSKLGNPVLNDSNIFATSPPGAWSGITVPDSLSHTSRPYWWPASPPAGVCTWPHISSLDDDFGGTLCKLPAECYWVDGNASCAPF